MQSGLPQLKLGPRYRIVDEIAAGGMGSVVLALRRGPAGHTPVAIKKLHAHLVDNPDVVTSFVDEARIASRIVHPNVVHVHDVEMIQDELMIVMDYVEGIPLRQLLRARTGEKGLPIPVVRRILVDTLHGLHAAHELKDERGAPLNVVHRDVSPHNLLVGTNGVTRVTDFGIAMAVGRIASTKPDGAVKGKLQYLSPEQVFRKAIDRRTDVFAAGVVAWEALVGRKLFDAGTEGETLAMIIREPIVPPSAHRLDVPLDLDEACLRALEREPDRRFASAEELACALEEGGTLATREEVAALVVAEAGDVFARRRELLEQTAVWSSLPPMQIRSVSDGDMKTGAMPQAAQATVLLPRRGRAISPIALMIVGSACVTGGLILGFNVRATPSSARPNPTQSAHTTQAPVPVTRSDSTEMTSASTPGVPVATSVSTSVVATPPPIVKGRPHDRAGPRAKADAGRGRPFMPDDL